MQELIDINHKCDTISLQNKIGEERDEELGDFIIDPNIEIQYEVLESVFKEELKVELRRQISDLKPNEKGVIEKRYGLDGNEPKTLAEVGEYYNLTRERIR